MPAVPKPRRRAKRRPKGLTRTRMKKRPNQVVRDRERMKHCASLPCLACLMTGRRQESRTQADHIRTRGAGGKEVENLWPLCALHHDERHRVGLRTFETMYHLDSGWAGKQVEYLFAVESSGV